MPVVIFNTRYPFIAIVVPNTVLEVILTIDLIKQMHGMQQPHIPAESKIDDNIKMNSGE